MGYRLAFLLGFIVFHGAQAAVAQSTQKDSVLAECRDASEPDLVIKLVARLKDWRMSYGDTEYVEFIYVERQNKTLIIARNPKSETHRMFSDSQRSGFVQFKSVGYKDLGRGWIDEMVEGTYGYSDDFDIKGDLKADGVTKGFLRVAKRSFILQLSNVFCAKN